MSSTNKTANYQLNQWVGSDPVLMADFNADNQKIDAALAAIPKIATGTYTGNGTAPKTLTFPFPPKLLIVTRDASHYTNQRIIALRGQSFAHNTDYQASNMGYATMLTWSGNSVTLTAASQSGSTDTSETPGAFNQNNQSYYYLAIG